MTNRTLIIIASLVALLVIAAGVLWFIRSRGTSLSSYNPFSSQQTTETDTYDPPSDFSSEFDRNNLPSIPTGTSLAPPSLPPNLIQ
ncbi:MAG: hypothetical protein ACOYUZ_05745 [Patescibacteria group bacterium]